ncbi:glycosyltransferase family 4 protein [Globicatella sulfidifaciens]|uniref:Glycosyltransferase family 4 protein n=1 Tax=Globicatella sulfidifaciens TaxID=136093 RepID=A0A7X8GZE9_9LACT|nr:glycosyltransferase family 4 protein [Globicatella sulfidifaciens]NLJ17366.1 glycosyltransferase family 4 protein [Globicatella sulfidifaciens]
MIIATVHDAAFHEENGIYYCHSIDYNLLTDLMKYFEQVNIVVRRGVKKPGYVKVDFSNINVYFVDAITTPSKFMGGAFNTYKVIRNVVLKSDLVYCRGINGIIAQYIAKKKGITDLVYLGGCIYDSMKHNGSFYKKIMAKIAFKTYQTSIKKSSNVIYVSRYLEDKYPTDGKAFTWSGVKINPSTNEIINNRNKRILNDKKEITIGLIGYVNNDIKGVDTAIIALRDLDKRYKLKILGAGNHDRYDRLTQELNLTDRVTFCGVLTGGGQVLSWLDGIDIYIQPSLTEGLPKATLEAMSRGCPVIASRAGGLSDIVSSEYLHEAKDADKLSKLLRQISSSEEEMLKLSKHSFKVAEQYSQYSMKKAFDSIMIEVTDQAKRAKETNNKTE